MFTISSTGLYARMGTSAHGLSHPFNPKTFANALGGIRNALEKSLHFQLEMNTSKGLRSGERGGHVPRDFFFFLFRCVNIFLKFVQTLQIHPYTFTGDHFTTHKKQTIILFI